MRPVPTVERLLLDPFFTPLKRRLIELTGLAYYEDKERDLARRIEERLVKLDLADCAAYLDLLADPGRGTTELDLLIEDLTIGETYFFRHRELFEALRDLVVPDLLARRPVPRQLRIWCAGCSIGAEPYSISILLKRELHSLLTDTETEIIGTDMNRHFLARAREGCYEEWALRGMADDVKTACFNPVGRRWALAPEFKHGVSFQYHNLVAHPFPSLVNDLCAFDVILCRNVTIYFSLPIVERLIEQFHQCLVPGGWLLVGHAEPNLQLFRSFRTVNAPGAVLYQKCAPTTEPATVAFAPREPSALAGGSVPWQPPVFPLDQPPIPAPPMPTAGVPPAPSGVPPPAEDTAAIRALADRGEWEQADSLCQRSLARDNLNPVVHFYHALVLEQRGLHREAEQSLRRVLYLDRNSVLAHYYLGLLLQKKAEFRPAARSFRNVLELLKRLEATTVFAEGDAITAGELQKLTQMHLEVLEGNVR